MAEDREEWSKKISRVISKAWSDEAFKKRLMSHARAVLKENGLTFPEGVVVNAVENTDKVFYLVIPPKPELKDEQLDKVAGGEMEPAHWIKRSRGPE
jgi:hypothetical protein